MEGARLTSVAHAELSGLIEEQASLKLPSNFHKLYATPAELQEYLKDQKCQQFPVKLSQLHYNDAHRLPSAVVLFVQGIGICVLVLLLMVSFSLMFLAGSFGPALESFANVTESSGSWKFWVWPAIVFPTFMLSFSLLVIAAKWLVIGRYRTGKLQVYSIPYLRWWFVDRLVHLWEMWVGVLIVDTPLIWIFYQLLGCHIHPRSQIKAFIREFDLVRVDSDTSIEQQIRCHRFGPWEEDSGPTLRFRQIEIGSSV